MPDTRTPYSASRRQQGRRSSFRNMVDSPNELDSAISTRHGDEPALAAATGAPHAAS